MIVMGTDGINNVALHVRQTLLPAAQDPHIASNLRFVAMCLDLIAEDYDRMVDVLVADRNEIVQIFRDAMTQLDGDLHSQVDERLAFKATDLRVRTLSHRADDDLRILIKLHEVCESRRLPSIRECTDINGKIWRFLENYAERRRYRSPI